MQITERVQHAISYFHAELKNARNAKEYLKSRGILKESVIKFYLGYAPAACRIAPRFHDRIIFPIWDPYGVPVGWTGRTLIGAPAKYLNVKESPVYQKGRILYPYHIAKSAIASARWAILVEGQMDAIILHQYGFPNTVATSGTTLKSAAANLLTRYADSVYIIFDADTAGDRARVKAAKALKEAGVNVYIVSLPTGQDPAEFIQCSGKNVFRQILNNTTESD